MRYAMQGNATCLMKAALMLDDLNFFRWACEIDSGRSPSATRAAGSAVGYDPEQLLVLEEKLVSSNYDLERVKPWHIAWLSCSPSLGCRFARLKPLVKLLAKKTDADALRPWFDDAVLSMMNSSPLRVYADDADILADATYRYEGEWVFERLMPTLRSRRPDNAFWLTFLDKVYTQGMPTERMRRIWKDALDHILVPNDDWRHDEPSATGWDIFPKIRTSISTDRLYMTLRGCVLIGASPQARAILTAATKQIAETQTTSIPCLVEPLIPRLVNSLAKRVVDDVKDALAHFVKTALKAYVRESVGFEPLRKRDWRRNPRGCGACAECEALNAFLLDRTQQTASFRKRTERRSHLIGQINGTASAFDKSQKLEVEEIDDGEWPKLLGLRKIDSVFDERHRIWRAKRDAMIAYVEELDPGNASALLGGLYERLLKTETYTRSVVTRPTIQGFLSSAGRERTLAHIRKPLMPLNANLGTKRALDEGENAEPDCKEAAQPNHSKRTKPESQKSSRPLDLLKKASG